MPSESDSPAFGRRAQSILVAITLAVLAVAPAGAQTTSIDRTGLSVDISANGERVQAAGATVNVAGNAADVSAAGASVTITGDVAEDITAAGANLDIAANAGRDINAGGATVSISGRAGNNVNAGGATVTVNAVVGGRLRIGGANVVVGPGSDIAGELEGGGANVRISGHIAGPVSLAGAQVTINARIDGSVDVQAGKVIIGAPARIGGDLTVRSPVAPQIDPAAVIAGQTLRLAPPQWWWPISPWARAAVFAALVAAGTIIAGVVLMLFGGRVFATATDHVRLRPGSSFLIGLVTAVLIPAIAVVVMATVVGITAGIAILLILPPLVVFGHAVAAAGIASGIFVRGQAPLGNVRAFILLVVGAIIVALIWLIPWAGAVLAAIILLFGVGALARTLGARVRRSEPAPA